MSCLRNGAGGAYLDLNKDFEKGTLYLSTANGACQKMFGKVTLDVSYRSITKPVEFYLVTNLAKDVFLGGNFWKAFDLVLEIFSKNLLA